MNNDRTKGTFWADFKTFAGRGNMIDLAVGVIVGGAFGKIITSLVNDILMPPIGMLLGGIDFKELKWVLTVPENGLLHAAPATINYGMFIQNVFDFLIVALCIFTVIRILTRLRLKAEVEAAPAPAAKSDEAALLEEIRDLLRERNKKATMPSEKSTRAKKVTK
jgi:large conductance mechanosensitive channel